MKRSLKVFLAFAILTVYIFASTSVFATEVVKAINTTIPTNTKEVKVQIPETYKSKGSIEVDLELVLPISNKTEKQIHLVLMKEKNNLLKADLNLIGNNAIQTFGEISVQAQKVNQNREPVIEGEEYRFLHITIEGLPIGDYQIQFTGQFFVTYTSPIIDVKEYSKRIYISNLKGSFALGDINADNQINQEDIDLLVPNMEKTDEELLVEFDINGDKEVNILDLTYIATNFKGEEYNNKIENTNPIISVEKLKKVEITENTVLEGEIEDLLSDSKQGVVLKNKEEKVISEQNPVTLSMEFEKKVTMQQVVMHPSELSDANVPTKMEIQVETDTGEIITVPYNNIQETEIAKLSEEQNSIVINLGKQLAVKRITIKIIETKNNTNLAEIAQVEFLNNIYEEIPAPKMDIPTGVKAELGSEKLTVFWNHAINVTGYKLKITGEGKTQYFETTKNYYEVTNLKNYKEYAIWVEAVNGMWESGYSEEIKAMPMPNRLPPVPENIKTVGKYQRIDINWKAMDDTQSYNIFYKKSGEKEYSKIEKITGTSYTLSDLEDVQEYEIQLSGNNHLGEGSKSEINKVTTVDLEAPIVTNYKLINTSQGEKQRTKHIQNVEYKSVSVTQNYDTWDIVDDDYTSYWRVNTWDTGGLNNLKNGPIITLDDVYQMDHIIVVPADFQPYHYDYCRIFYWNEEGKQILIPNINMQRKISSNNKVYYDISFNEPINAQKVQFNFASTGGYYGGGGKGPITIAEVKFYYYDDLETKVRELFTDDLRIQLASNVTITQIEELEVRANTIDFISGEYHPNREIILADLEYAKKILQDTAMSDSITVDQKISNSRNNHLGFAFQLNDFQPLGIVANAGEQLAVYVGADGNANVNNLELVFTQYYPEANAWKATTTSLQKGQNILTVPQITSTDVEQGGAVYIRYTNKNASNGTIKVRVSGGHKIPVLDIHGITDQQVITDKMNIYLQQLKSQVEQLDSYYTEKGQTYKEATSILNSTEIITDNVLLSIPASRALSGLTANTETQEQQVKKLQQTTQALEEMMALFYKEKGLQRDAEDSKNEMPGSRINIRYTRMFDGAFMYASSGHIGIGLGSVAGLMQGRPAQKNENGVYTTSGFFGWGISHEIGHVIDEGDMVVGETTNNIFSLLAQTADDKQLSRLETSQVYPKIYEKVTSHTTGLPTNVFTALGMFWQLHLAYDNDLTLTNQDSFYARLNTLYRHETFDKSIDKYNKLIRLASEAAQKDLTEFFEIWGLKATEETKQYLQDKGLEKETKAIYYLNDEARRYRLQAGTAMEAEVKADLELITNTKQVKLNFEVSQQEEKLLGYEILRNEKSVGFTTEASYIDALNALNNRVLNYEIVAYDKLLNEVGRVTLEPVKIEYDGTINKFNFSITSNRQNEIDENEYETDKIVNPTINLFLDNDNTTLFNGNTRKSINEKATPYVLIELNEILPIAGLRYTAGVENGNLVENTIQQYKISVSEDNQNWQVVKIGTFDAVTAEQPTQHIYFDAPGSSGGNQLYTAQTAYIKIEAIGNKGISGAEIDLIAPPGDNISIENENVYILKEEYRYAKGADQQGQEYIIPAGSVVLKGTYRGNPAYNAALLLDQEENTIENYEQLFMAELPENATLDEVASGYWIAYMSRENYEKMLEKQKVKINLYRVNNAETLEGQRLVSDTFYINLKPYDSLQSIILKDEMEKEL